MPEIMKICPNCKGELTVYDWDYYDREDCNWFTSVEKDSCECPHCKKFIWVKLPYELNENNIEIEIEDD